MFSRCFVSVGDSAWLQVGSANRTCGQVPLGDCRKERKKEKRGCGANLRHVKELVGHENLETLQHYTKLTIEDLKATQARCHPRENERAA